MKVPFLATEQLTVRQSVHLTELMYLAVVQLDKVQNRKKPKYSTRVANALYEVQEKLYDAGVRMYNKQLRR